MVTCSGFHGSITWSNVRLRMFSWPICSEPVVSLGIEQNQRSAQYNSIRLDIWATKRVNIYSVQSGNLLSNLKRLSALVVNKNLRTDATFFCSDSTCTHPLCSSFFMLVCFERVAAFFLEQVHHLIQLSFCCILLPFFNKYFPALGWLLLYVFTDVFIYQPPLSAQIWRQTGFCCNVFCSDSTRTHPLCSSCLSCWFVLGGFAVCCFSCCMFLRAST